MAATSRRRREGPVVRRGTCAVGSEEERLEVPADGEGGEALGDAGIGRGQRFDHRAPLACEDDLGADDVRQSGDESRRDRERDERGRQRGPPLAACARTTSHGDVLRATTTLRVVGVPCSRSVRSSPTARIRERSGTSRPAGGTASGVPVASR